MIQENPILSLKRCKHINNGIALTFKKRTGGIEINKLIDLITDFENLDKAYRKSQSGKSKYRKEALRFVQNETDNLLQLQRELKDGTYKFSGYFEFTVTEPKERVINAPYYRDKIVQLAINNILKDIYAPCFIYDTYACLDGKGTHSCVERVQCFMRKAKWEYGDEAYIVKMDIKKFFYSIDRDILKSLLPRKIKCRETLDLLYKIIDSAKDIDDLGMPLGNTISQLCANIYMNMVDQYAKRGLGLKYYVRYADDIVTIVESKDKANEVLENIRNHARSKLNLDLNEHKSKIFPIKQGVNTVGFKIHPTHMLLRNDSKKRIKKKLSKMKRLIVEDRMTIEKAEQILNSWLGHAKQGCSYNFIGRLLDKYDFLIFTNNTLKIDRKVIEDERTLQKR